MNKKYVFPLLKFHPTKRELMLIGSVQPHGLNFLPQSLGQKTEPKIKKERTKIDKRKKS
jgi:hypothetical protein